MNEVPYFSPAELVEATGDLEAIRTPYGNEVRKQAAIQAVRNRFYREWHRITADCEAEIARIKREGV